MLKKLHIFEKSRAYAMKIAGRDYIDKSPEERRDIFNTITREELDTLYKIDCDGVTAYLGQIFGWTGNTFGAGEAAYIIVALRTAADIIQNNIPGADEDAQRLQEIYKDHVSIEAVVIKGGGA